MNTLLIIIGLSVLMFFGYGAYLNVTAKKIFMNQDGEMYLETTKGVYKRVWYENGQFKFKD